MVAKSGPQHRFAEHGRVDVEEVARVFRVGTAGVGIVTEHQPQVGVAGASVAVIPVANGGLNRTASARIAEDPHTGRLCARRRGQDEVVAAAGQRGGAVADRVVIGRVWREAGQPNFVFRNGSGVRRGEVEVARRRAVFHDAIRRGAGAPTNGGGGSGAVLQVRSARQGLSLRKAWDQSQKGQDGKFEMAIHVGVFS